MNSTRRIRFAVVAALLALGSGSLGCKETIAPPPPPPPPPRGINYQPQTSPEAVVWNLRVAYLRRDIEGYGKLLAPEFRFYFQDADAPWDLGRDFWIHDEDSTHTAILFRTPKINNISVDLTYEDAVPATEAGMPAGSVKIHATARLDVDDVNGTTYVVDGDFEDFYLRKGSLQYTQEDTTRWYLFEWRDIRNPGGSSAATAAGVEPTAAKRATWGGLKQLYR